ncbi:MAG: hypothetical protein WBO46_27420, partial [Caldilineaceae bacterium]
LLNSRSPEILESSGPLINTAYVAHSPARQDVFTELKAPQSLPYERVHCKKVNFSRGDAETQRISGENPSFCQRLSVSISGSKGFLQ